MDLTNNNIITSTSDLNNLKFNSNFEYRKFLTANGTSISNINNINSINKQMCNCNYYHTNSMPLTNNSSPFLFDNIMQTDTPYGYTESDLKDDFINKRLRQQAQYNFRITNID